MWDSIDITTPTPTMEDSNEDWFHSILKAKSPPTRTTQIHRVPMILKERTDHEKYYLPKVVSLGPYHHGKPNLESVEGFKPLFTNKLLNSNQDLIRGLYHNLAEMVQTLRGYYEDDIDHLSDDEFTRMMLLDGCFIMYVIQHIFLNNEIDTLGLKGHQAMFVQQDMFLLENQIPYRVLTEVMKFVPDEMWDLKIKRFVDDNILATERRRRRLLTSAPVTVTEQKSITDRISPAINHLLELLQARLTKEKSFGPCANDRYTFRNVNELIEVGISFKPSRTRSLAHIKFTKQGFCAILELPPLIARILCNTKQGFCAILDSTKPILLNLVAYEMCSNNTNAAWVTSYICLLDSLIDHSEDVQVLRKAGILDNRLGSDKEVAQLFNQIGTDLVPNNFAYSVERSGIQRHYESRRNTWMTQLKHEYIKSPWAFVALLVGLVGLFLSSVQTYFSVWGIESHCDSFCLYLKKHHKP